MDAMTVATGLDRLVEGEVKLPPGKVGLITHGAALTRRGIPAHLALHRAGVNIEYLMSPEHGLYSAAQDMEGVGDMTDPMTGLTVLSLYGHSWETLAPDEDVLSELDVVVWDIQDIGTRYYTYVWTALMALQRLHELGRQLWILDRPNPVDGVHIEGNIGEIRSFVGMHPVLTRHGLTAGELLTLAAAELGLSDALHVIRMKGWRRAMMYKETGLPWVPPSPNMPSVEAALVYPGMCLVEATTLSEGRGTTTPFLVAGAPYIDPVALTDELGEVPGLTMIPTYFRPMFQKYAGQVCGGIRLAVTSPEEFDSWVFGLNFLSAVRRLWPENFAWRADAYEFVKDIPAIDMLTGDPSVRKRIEAGDTFTAEEFAEERKMWQYRREEYLMYD